MKKIIPFLIGILWLMIIAGIAFYDGISFSHRESMNLCQDGITAEGQYYVMENREKESVVYQITPDRSVSQIFFTGDYKEEVSISGIAWQNSLFVLLQERENSYRIIELDSKMKAVRHSGLVSLKEQGSISGFSVDEKGFYLTLLTKDREAAYTYFLDRQDSLTEFTGKEEKSEKETGSKGKEESKEEAVFLKLYRMMEAEEGRKIVDAAYLEGEYKLRLDNGIGKEDFLLSEEILDAFYGRSLSMGQILRFQQENLAFYFVLLLLGYLVLVIAAILLRNRNHTVYTIVTVECILLAMTLLGTFVTYQTKKETVTQQNKEFGVYYLQELQRQITNNYQYYADEEDFYDTEMYYEVWAEMTGFMREEGPDQMFHNLAIVKMEDQRVLAGTEGKNIEHAAYQFSTMVIPLLEKLQEGYHSASIEVWLNGRSYLVVGVTDKEELKPEYCFLGMLKNQESKESVLQTENYFFYGEMIFLLGSILCIFIILFQERDLRKLSRSMVRLASGNYNVKKEASYGKDVDTMWSSLLEIQKRIARINHAKFKLYESCYRFAPKNIEQILGKDSITEVNNGDIVELYGTLAIINLEQLEEMEHPDMQQINRYVELMEKHKDQKEGFFLRGSNNLKDMKMLFLQECRLTTEFGTGFTKEFQGLPAYHTFRPGIVLHYDHYMYGVTGSEQQSFSFLFYRKMERLEKLGQWLRALGIHLAVTHTVKEREGLTKGFRYIGYIQFEGDSEKTLLYEILDACTDAERRKKQGLDEKFQKALELFYQYDFYLARSSFSELLKENQEDEIIKWYLFTCQKYLNQSYSGEISFELWESKK